MSTEIVLRVFNLLVHYGEDNNRNFRHLLKDGFFHLFDEEAIVNAKGMTSYIDKLKYISADGSYYCTGIFYKEARINIDHKKNKDQKAVNDPIREETYPRAYFVLDLVKHRLYWFTKKYWNW